MVHSWQQLHARITVKDKENDRVFYLDPSVSMINLKI